MPCAEYKTFLSHVCFLCTATFCGVKTAIVFLSCSGAPWRGQPVKHYLWHPLCGHLPQGDCLSDPPPPSPLPGPSEEPARCSDLGWAEEEGTPLYHGCCDGEVPKQCSVFSRISVFQNSQRKSPLSFTSTHCVPSKPKHSEMIPWWGTVALCHGSEEITSSSESPFPSH